MNMKTNENLALDSVSSMRWLGSAIIEKDDPMFRRGFYILNEQFGNQYFNREKLEWGFTAADKGCWFHSHEDAENFLDELRTQNYPNDPHHLDETKTTTGD